MRRSSAGIHEVSSSEYSMLSLENPPRYQRMSAVPQVSPPPMVAISTRSCGLILPARMAVSSVIGSEDEDVFP